MIIETILEVAGKLFGLKDQLLKARREKRDRIAEYFGEVGKTLSEVSESLKRGEVPHGKCEEMRVFAEMLPATVDGVINPAEAIEYSEKLKQAHEVEGLLSELSGSPSRNQMLADLDKASGLFNAVSVTIKAAG